MIIQNCYEQTKITFPDKLRADSEKVDCNSFQAAPDFTNFC